MIGTHTLLKAARDAWLGNRTMGRHRIGFTMCPPTRSTAPWADDPAFTETHRLCAQLALLGEQGGLGPLVRAFHHTYGLQVTISNCSNNYGPYQFPEKLIPLMILNASRARRCPCTATAEHARLAVRGRPLQRHRPVPA